MELEVGKTYRSPHHGRYIRVDSFEYLRTGDLLVSVHFVDKDTAEEEFDVILVTSKDSRQWKVIN